MQNEDGRWDESAEMNISKNHLLLAAQGRKKQEKLGKLWSKLVPILTSKSAFNWTILNKRYSNNKKMENKAIFFWLFFHTLEPIHNTKMTPIKMRPHLILKYRACAFITRSWFETALDYKPRFLGSKIEEYPCLVHKLSVININCSIL